MNIDPIEESTDFFACGAGSMDVTRCVSQCRTSCTNCIYIFRLVEEIKEKCGGIEMINEEVYMNSSFGDFARAVVLKSRGVGLKDEIKYDAVSILFSFHCFKYFICFISVFFMYLAL